MKKGALFCSKELIREPKPTKKGNKGTTGHPSFGAGYLIREPETKSRAKGYHGAAKHIGSPNTC